MPGPLQFLEVKSRDEVASWLKSALCGVAPVPREYPDQPVSGAIAAASPALADQARKDLSAAAIDLLAGLATGRHKNEYVASLLRLVTDLDLRGDAIPILRNLASRIPTIKKHIGGWDSCARVLLTLLNLRDLRDADYWLRLWALNKRSFSPVTLAALFDLDPSAALGFLPQLPDSPEFGALAAITLDQSADTFHGNERRRFREAAAAAAAQSSRHVKRAISEWLAETSTPRQDLGYTANSSPTKLASIPAPSRLAEILESYGYSTESRSPALV